MSGIHKYIFLIQNSFKHPGSHKITNAPDSKPNLKKSIF